MSNDGGARAISGFLYQVLAGGALRAAGDCEEYQTGSPHLDALIELAATGDVIHEVADEDLVVQNEIVNAISGKTSMEVTLVQAKFSVAGQKKSIGPAELKEIVEALHTSAQRLKKSGNHVAGYFLVTNRVVTRKEVAVAGEQKKILARLKKVPGVNLDRWHDAFMKFGRQFGLQDQEIIRGREQLLGRIFTNTGGHSAQATISRDDLRECLTGNKMAMELSARRLATQLSDELSCFDADLPPGAIRRELLREAQELSAHRALVILAGKGGMGKTAALYQWTTELVEKAKAGSPAPMVAIRSAHPLPRDWLVELVHDWNPALRPTSDKDALERLSIANAQYTPVLHLALDGADEERGVGLTTPELQRLIAWFGQLDRAALAGKRAPARLVVTCRSEKRFLNDVLGLSRSGVAPDPQKLPPVVHFGVFSEAELRALLEANHPEFLSDLLPDAADLDDPEIGTASFHPSPSVKPQVTELLQDPVMWRGFCVLSVADKWRLIKGDPDVQLKLAGFFCDRFLVKARDRTGIDASLLEVALRSIAFTNRAAGITFRKPEDWIKPASTAGLGITQAQHLCSEADSGGLIHRNDADGRWDWRNPAIEGYLALPTPLST